MDGMDLLAIALTLIVVAVIVLRDMEAANHEARVNRIRAEQAREAVPDDGADPDVATLSVSVAPDQSEACRADARPVSTPGVSVPSA